VSTPAVAAGDSDRVDRAEARLLDRALTECEQALDHGVRSLIPPGGFHEHAVRAAVLRDDADGELRATDVETEHRGTLNSQWCPFEGVACGRETGCGIVPSRKS
jgi:hypothetical protein